MAVVGERDTCIGNSLDPLQIMLDAIASQRGLKEGPSPEG